MRFTSIFVFLAIASQAEFKTHFTEKQSAMTIVYFLPSFTSSKSASTTSSVEPADPACCSAEA